MYFLWDTETTGLPKTRQPNYKDLDAYVDCRLVSICWIILDENYETVSTKYHVIKPNGFIIPEDATKIHGITHDFATETGVPLTDILPDMLIDLKKCTTLVAHNLSFDFGVMLSEFHRYGKRDMINNFFRQTRYCTMFNGRTILGLKKVPTLSSLYETLTGTVMVGAHNAQVDTECCAKCFVELSARANKLAKLDKLDTLDNLTATNQNAPDATSEPRV